MAGRGNARRLDKLLRQLNGPTDATNAQQRVQIATDAIALLDDDSDPQLVIALAETLADGLSLTDQAGLTRALSTYEGLIPLADPDDHVTRGRLAQKLGQARLWAEDPSPDWIQQTIDVLEWAAAECPPSVNPIVAALVRRTLFDAYRADDLSAHADEAAVTAEELIALGAATVTIVISLAHLHVASEDPPRVRRGIELLRALGDDDLRETGQWFRRQVVLVHGLIATRERQPLDEAIAAGEEALQGADDNATLLRLSLLNGLVDAYVQRANPGDSPIAFRHANAAYDLSVQVDDPGVRAEAATQVGYAFISSIGTDRVRAVEEAIRWYQRALETADKSTHPALWGRIQHNLGEAYRQRVTGLPSDNQALAIAAYEQALEVFQRSSVPSKWAETTNSLALVHLESLADPDTGPQTALQLLQDVVDAGAEVADMQTRGRAINSYALALLACGAGEQALPVLRDLADDQSLNPRLRAAVRVNLAAVEVEAGHVDAAEADYRTAAQLAASLDDQSIRVDALNGLATLLLDAHRWDDAATASAEAEQVGFRGVRTAVVPKSRRAFVHSVARANVTLTRALTQQGRYTDALLALDRGRARLLAHAIDVDAAAQLVDENKKGAFDAARRAIRMTEAELAAPPDSPTRRPDAELYTLLEANRRWLDALIEAAQQEDPAAFHRDLTFDDLLRCVPADGALVAICISSDGGLAFVLPHDTTQLTGDNVVALPEITNEWLLHLLWGDGSEQDDERRHGWWWSYVRRHTDPEQWDETLQWTIAICSALITPIAAQLRDLGIHAGARVVLLLPGGLAGLPVHAAPLPDGGTFLERHPVSFAPCARVLKPRDHEPAGAALRARVIANPTEDLPFATAEGAAVAELFADCEVIAGSEATLSTVGHAMEPFSHWHFACHASHDMTDPSHSSVVLADRLLTGDLLVDLPEAPVVVLSGCETGLLDILDTPDEFAGLQTEFLQAGAQTVVSSLWPVNDESTMLLMQRFYREHLSGLSPAVAIQRAALWLRAAPAPELAACLKPFRATSPEVREAWRSLATLPADTTPFAQPRYWAVMVVAGQ